MNLAENILTQRESVLALEAVPVPEWDCTVFVRGWTALDQELIRDEKNKAEKHLMARVLCLCLRNEDGSLLFSLEQAADLADRKSAASIERLFHVCVDKCGVLENEKETAKKNSPAIPASCS